MTITCAAWRSSHQWTKEGNDEALSNLYRAIELDPNFAAAYGLAARCYVLRKAGGWVTDRDSRLPKPSDWPGGLLSWAKMTPSRSVLQGWQFLCCW